MQGQNNERVLWRQGFHLCTCDRNFHGAPKQIFGRYIHRIEKRLNCPLHLKQVFSRGPVECTFVSRAQIGLLLVGRKRLMGNVTQFRHRSPHAAQVSRFNEQINVPRLPQTNIAINGFCQCQPLVRQELDASLRQAVGNTHKFAREKQRFVEIGLVTLLQSRQRFIGNLIFHTQQRLCENRQHSVTVGECIKSIPTDFGP